MIRMLRVPLLSLCKPKVWNSLSLYMQSLIYISFKEPELNCFCMWCVQVPLVSLSLSGTLLGTHGRYFPAYPMFFVYFLNSYWLIWLGFNSASFWEEPICWILVSLSGCKCNSGCCICFFVCCIIILITTKIWVWPMHAGYPMLYLFMELWFTGI